MECPICGSSNVLQLDTAKRAGGAIGAVGGAATGAMSALSGAEIGGAVGAIAGPAGYALGSIAGAFIGILVGGTTGCAAGAKLGEIIDEKVLNHCQCQACQTTFRFPQPE